MNDETYEIVCPVVPGEGALALPAGSRFLPCGPDGTTYHNSTVRTVGLAGPAGVPKYALVLYCAPVPGANPSIEVEHIPEETW